MKCVECKKEIDENVGTTENPLCKSCYNRMNQEYSREQATKKPVTSNLKTILCKQCGSEMARTKKTDKSIGLQIVGVFVFFLGVVLLFVFPIGTIIGIILMIVAARLGYKQVKVWKCKSCGYFFERAD
jgi:DNA-directed RNA polymerase subunit RPC12/RpoP